MLLAKFSVYIYSGTSEFVGNLFHREDRIQKPSNSESIFPIENNVKQINPFPNPTKITQPVQYFLFFCFFFKEMTAYTEIF